MAPAYSGSGAWRAVFEPGYALTGKVGEDELKTGLALQLVRSSNRSLSPDRESPTAFLNWLRQSEAGEFGISSKYTEVATRDSVVDATGQVPASSTRDSRSLSGNWSKALSELNALLLNASYEGVTYKGGNFVDYSTQSAGLKFSHELNERLTSFFRLSGNKYVPVGGGPSSNLADLALGLGRKAEYMDWIVQVGESKVAGGDTVTEGSVETSYTGQQTKMTLNASRLVTPSGMGGFVKANHVKGSWSYALSEYSNTGFDLERQMNLSATITTVTGSNTITGVWIDRSLAPLWKMQMYCRHRVNQADAGYSASSNILGITLSVDSAAF